jgi:hypothetical protein
MTVRVRDGAFVETGYDKPIVVIKYINDAVVVVTPFGSFILSPTSVAYIDSSAKNSAVADIKREGEQLRFEPRPDAEKIKDLIRAYLPEFLPPHLMRCGNKIYLGDAEVGTVYELH